MDETKITVKIYSGLLNKFNDNIKHLHIKRDAFLNAMIKCETPNLAQELSGKRQSNEAKRYIAGSLKRLGADTVNIVVEKSTVAALDEVISSCNVVRDAFVNRMIYFLVASDRILKFLELPTHITGSNYQQYVEAMPTCPMEAMKAVAGDPLYYLRRAIEERYECGLYALDLPAKLDGFACFLPDDRVPGTEDSKKAQAMLDELMNIELDSLEASALTIKKRKSK